MGNERVGLGRRGEVITAGYLELCGMQILQRNWRPQTPGRSRLGEIDIVARDNSDLVVVEVKTRRSFGHGTPMEAITPQKVGRLRQLGSAWLAEHPRGYRRVRIDAVGILLAVGGPARIDHRRGVC